MEHSSRRLAAITGSPDWSSNAGSFRPASSVSGANPRVFFENESRHKAPPFYWRYAFFTKRDQVPSNSHYGLGPGGTGPSMTKRRRDRTLEGRVPPRPSLDQEAIMSMVACSGGGCRSGESWVRGCVAQIEKHLAVRRRTLTPKTTMYILMVGHNFRLLLQVVATVNDASIH